MVGDFPLIQLSRLSLASSSHLSIGVISASEKSKEKRYIYQYNRPGLSELEFFFQFSLDLIGLRAVEGIHEEPDRHFLIMADLRPE
jgi:hypothetical protein